MGQNTNSRTFEQSFCMRPSRLHLRLGRLYKLMKLCILFLAVSFIRSFYFLDFFDREKLPKLFVNKGSNCTALEWIGR